MQTPPHFFAGLWTIFLADRPLAACVRRAVLRRYYLNGVDAFRLKLWFPEELKRSARAAAASGAGAGAPSPRGGKALLEGEKAGEGKAGEEK